MPLVHATFIMPSPLTPWLSEDDTRQLQPHSFAGLHPDPPCFSIATTVPPTTSPPDLLLGLFPDSETTMPSWMTKTESITKAGDLVQSAYPDHEESHVLPAKGREPRKVKPEEVHELEREECP